MITIFKFESFIINNNIFCIHIKKFNNKTIFNLIILFIIDKNWKIGYYNIILLFNLLFGSRIKDSRKFFLNFLEII